MKIIRSCKVSLKFATDAKRRALKNFLKLYGEAVNFFINRFWENPISKAKLLKDEVNSFPSPRLSARAKKVAAREALDMILGAKRSAEETGLPLVKPIHYGKTMSCSSTLASLIHASNARHFDAWLHLMSLGTTEDGESIILDLPIKFHKHYHKLAAAGRRMASYRISEDKVCFAFEIEVDSKKEVKKIGSADAGINCLVATSTGNLYGKDVKMLLEKIRRCKWGSKRQKSLRRALRQRIDEVIKEFMTAENFDLVVIENLLGISKNTKQRKNLNRKMRFFLGSWNIGYYTTRLKEWCERNRVSFRTVASSYNSQKCPVCSHTEKKNRKGEAFCCKKCGYILHADVVGAQNALSRFLSGPYGAGCKDALWSNMSAFFSEV